MKRKDFLASLSQVELDMHRGTCVGWYNHVTEMREVCTGSGLEPGQPTSLTYETGMIAEFLNGTWGLSSHCCKACTRKRLWIYLSETDEGFDYSRFSSMSSRQEEPMDLCQVAYHKMRLLGSYCYHCGLDVVRRSARCNSLSPQRLVNVGYTHDDQQLVPSCIVCNYTFAGLWISIDHPDDRFDVALRDLFGSLLRSGEYDPVATRLLIAPAN
jgi:hypothetical protein